MFTNLSLTCRGALQDEGRAAGPLSGHAEVPPCHSSPAEPHLEYLQYYINSWGVGGPSTLPSLTSAGLSIRGDHENNPPLSALGIKNCLLGHVVNANRVTVPSERLGLTFSIHAFMHSCIYVFIHSPCLRVFKCKDDLLQGRVPAL